VEAINAFREAHGLLPIVVCSRVGEYAELRSRLRLGGAIVVQPLTRSQVTAYLRQMGRLLAGLRAALREDGTLWEMLETPLMLNIVTLAYQGQSAAAMRMSGTPEERRRHLFAAYVARMFARRGNDTRYSRDLTLHWLTYLARGMVQHSQSVFYIEQLQPNWLPTRAACWRYTIIDRLGSALGAGSAVGLGVGLSYELGIKSGTGLTNGLAFGLVAGLGVGLLGRTTGARAAAYWSKGYVTRRFVLGGLTFGLVVELIVGLLNGLQGSLVYGLFGALVGGLGCALLGGPSLRPRYITVVETLHWSWPRGLTIGLVVGLGVGLISVLVYGLSQRPEDRLSFGLIFGLVYGLSTGLIFGLTVGEIETKSIPNQGIWRSAQLAPRGGLGAGLASAVGAVLGGALVHKLEYGLFYGLSAATLVCLGGGIVCGGFACLQHFVLRFLLWHNGSAPWNYARFLDYAAERILLRKVGGGYIFVHRLLMEYFAALEPRCAVVHVRPG
jgi:hypothetical protein